MITAFLGFALAARLAVIDNFREHVSETPIILYSGDTLNSIWYAKRQSRFVVGNVMETWSNGQSKKGSTE